MGRLALVISALLLLAGCGGDSGDGAPEASGTTTTTTQRPPPPAKQGYPYINPIKRKGSSPPELAGDGRYFGYIRAADATTQTVKVDVAQFFFGDDVQKAAEEDGAVAPGEPVPNDHYERNSEQKSQPLKVSSKAAVTAAPAGFLIQYVSDGARRKCEMGASPVPCPTFPVSLDRFFAAVGDLPPALYGIPAWLTIADDQVVRIDEQYFP